MNSSYTLKSAFLTLAKHSAFGKAKQVLRRIQEIGLDEADEYESILRRRVESWKTFLEDTQALREKYQKPDSIPSYRELLLLVDRIEEPPTSTEKAYLSAYDISWRANPDSEPSEERGERGLHSEAGGKRSSLRFTGSLQAGIWLTLACLAGIFIGVTGGYLSQDLWGSEPNPTRMASQTVPDSLVPKNRYERVVRMSTFLAEGRPSRAGKMLDSLGASATRSVTFDSLHVSVQGALYRAGMRAWEEENYERVVHVLKPLRDEVIGAAQRKLYYLGVAAAKTGRSSLAVEVLQDLVPKLDQRYSHFEAQAAYLLAKLAPREMAQRYARLIADKYQDTIYYNSVVKARLDGA